MKCLKYVTNGDVVIHRHEIELACGSAINPIIDALDEHLGVVLTSGYEYPGRYTRWDIGFINPPLCITAKEYDFDIRALNQRGVVLLRALIPVLQTIECCKNVSTDYNFITGKVVPNYNEIFEEERSKRPSIFTVLRAIIKVFASDIDAYLGLYGAFGYDLAFQFEPIKLHLSRPQNQRDLVLYLPDQIVVVDHQREIAKQYSYDFIFAGHRTHEFDRFGIRKPSRAAVELKDDCDHAQGEYAEIVREALKSFKCGDLFEVVPSQTFFSVYKESPSIIFNDLRKANPSPFGALLNLGEGEYIISASPEMYVRVDGERVETCPIAGTIARGADAFADAQQILQLLNSTKDESELTMCTDVDRNDKSRVCKPGTVRVLGRRHIEMYSRLIHTVDHIEGFLKEGFDALDAFLAHTWAVTVTGAPKSWAMQFIEDHEKSPRAWYGGALGTLNFNGNCNTGLTIRTMRIINGIAEVRAGATLLYGSDPEAEEQETRLKASALLGVLQISKSEIKEVSHKKNEILSNNTYSKKININNSLTSRILLIDHQDSFVHTLGSYLRDCEVEVKTLRSGFSAKYLDEYQPHLAVLSPGPGSPSDFLVSRTISLLRERKIPIFGVCLGLQGIVEYFGGTLSVLPEPKHGKSTSIKVLGGELFSGLPSEFTAGRYHSLFVKRDELPGELIITAISEDEVIMAIEHETEKIAAVQFHPESIMTMQGDIGRLLLHNLVQCWSA
ncbi:MAG: anthranilate synthase component I [Deltaproteobacteria bacterium]|nr:anthranilate synthase component I [Deltaproteobacteria bacterium]